MTDFTKILDKAKELEAKMKESQENIKKLRVEGISGANSVRVILDGEGIVQKIEISDEILKENKSVLEDLIIAAFNNAKTKLNDKTTEEISKTAEEENSPEGKDGIHYIVAARREELFRDAIYAAPEEPFHGIPDAPSANAGIDKTQVSFFFTCRQPRIFRMSDSVVVGMSI